MKTIQQHNISRRRFVLGASSAVALGGLSFPHNLLANSSSDSIKKYPDILTGNRFDLQIGYQKVNYTGKHAIATTVNGSLPAPILCWKEGERVNLRVTNNLKHDSSIHWHGIILPSTMDGSPGFDFAGIKPGETFEYEFDVKQNGTYWYHSHSGFQEQTGLLGAIIIDPKDTDPINYDRDMVIVLSDWSDTPPDTIYANLKKQSHYYNYRERTFGDLKQDITSKGITNTWKERAMWNQMRMSDRDIADVTGYTYLMNGFTPEQQWLGACQAGEKVRLRFINGGAMTIFDVRIPGLKMTVVAADGQAIQPVTVDEFRIGNAETYDVIVTPEADNSYTIFAQTIDRSGFACGTLTTNPAIRATIPAMDAAPLLTHEDMGMSNTDHNHHHVPEPTDHSMHSVKNDIMDHSGHDMSAMSGMDHSKHNMEEPLTMEKPVTNEHAHHDMRSMHVMDHSGHDMGAMQTPQASFAQAGIGSNFDNTSKAIHSKTEFGPQVDSRTEMPCSGLNDPGIGLRNHQQKYGRKVLTYADLRSLHPTRDKRQPTREIELHLTGNMHRYMWSIDGLDFMQAAPIQLAYGERVRIILVNDTMMTHPFHLHGMWSELETGDPDFIPRKHTVLVQPGSKISYLVTADAKGRWAYHCHMLYHMLGMMRMVKVV